MAHTLPSSSISLESHKRCRPQPMSSTGIDPPPPPYKKQKQPAYYPPIDAMTEPLPVINFKPWPMPPVCRKSWAGSLASVLCWPAFGLMRKKDAYLITEKIEDEAYKAADAAADISLEERRSMYSDLMYAQIEKYHLSESEFSARLESDPRYSVYRPTSNWLDVDYEPEVPYGLALWKPQIEQAQLQTPHAPSCVTTSSQQRQDSGMLSHESHEAIQAILSAEDKLGQVLLQHPNLLKVLQEKLEQL